MTCPTLRLHARHLAVGLLALLLALPAAAADYLGHALREDGLHISTTDGRLRLSFRGHDAIEAHYLPEGRRQLPSFAIAPDAPLTEGRLVDSPDRLVYAADGLRAVVHKAPLRIEYFRGGTRLLAEEAGLFHHETLRGFRFQLAEGEQLMGTGQRVLGMDRRGHRLPLDNRPHYGYGTESEQMYFSLPAVLSDRKYLLLFDNSARGWVDLGKSEPDVLQFEAPAGRTAYVVVAGESYPEIIRNYVAVTGAPPLPARWTLGNYASRFGYRSEAEAREVVRLFREHDIPLDAIVLDLYWFGPDIKGHMGRLDWDRQAFPDPEGMLRDFAGDGVRTILVTEPFILTSSSRWEEAVREDVLARDLAGRPKTFDFYFGNTGIVDIFSPRARDWFWGIYRGLTAQGVTGWWGDLGEPEVHPHDTVHSLGTADEVHNAYGHEWARLVYEGLRADFPGRRPFVMMRAGFAGSQRYGMVPWTGDVDRSWDGLRSQVELALQMGLFGFGWIHSDLGGFAGGEAFDAELYLRWLQYGVFQPVFRPHAQEHIAPEPVFHDERTRGLAREAVRLRYRLLPYHYTLAWEHASTGLPLMRPLFFLDEADPALVARTDAYLWGDAFLVAPVVDPGATEKTLALPRGVWFDFHDGRRHEGGQSVVLALDPSRIPVLVRAGSFVPMVAPVVRTRDYRSDAFELHYWADASVEEARGRMYEDDGERFGAHLDGGHELLDFDARHDGDGLRLRLSRSDGDYPGRPDAREVTVVVHGWTAAPREVVVAGEPLAADAVGFDPTSGTVRFGLHWAGPSVELRLR